jgi:cytochrome c-type biogenesis protein CcmH/NrfG
MYPAPLKFLIFLPGGLLAVFIVAFTAFLVTGWLREKRAASRVRRVTDEMHNQADELTMQDDG